MLSLIIIMTLVSTNFSIVGVSADSQNENTEKNNYIVITKNESSFNAVANEYYEYISEDCETSGDLQDDNILVTEMTSAEAQSIEAESGVLLVEEDGLVTASRNNNSNNKEKTKANKKETSKNNIDKEWNIKAVNAV